ncbi:MAG: glycoside hydrolase family 2 protein [Ignavibacteriaceae bacterium]
MNKKYLLHDGWKFSIKKSEEEIPGELRKKIKEDKWLKAVVPGTVQTDLLQQKLIPDPFYSDNEIKLQWIGKQNWVYKTSFNLPENFNGSQNIFLVFEGVDTSAVIILNDTLLGTVENMFRSYKFEISKLLTKENNELEILFTSPEIYAKQLESKYGKLPVALRSERVHIRKAQYSFGWDWGPAFITQGIWKPVYLLQTDEYYFENFSFDTISLDEDKAKVKIKIKLNKTASSPEGTISRNLSLNIKLWDGNRSFEFTEKLSGSDSFQKDFKLENIVPWFPNGYGDPHLYNIQIQLIDEENVLDEINKKIGIRTVKLILKDEEKNSFKFQINNQPIFAKGANWIPGDSFLPRVTGDIYKKLLSLAKEANMNIVRVWGGGIYENDIFYELCDELGLMVWQDFMFACASYPEHPEFLENVSHEVKQNVSRLQYHPSIIIWCGNNENEWIWYRERNKSYKEMSGYKIYHELIPSILTEIDPNRPYWASTPFSFEEDPNSEISGNRHQWDLWSGWIDYKHVKHDQSLFVTEFGFQAPANNETMLSILPKEERFPNGKIFEFHNKQVEGPERLVKFLSGHLPVKNNLKDFIYLTQLNQGFALKTCVEHWQSRFPDTNGSIIWQLNDVWPVSSWSLIDSHLLPKMAYYFVKQAFNPQIILFERKEKSIYINVQNNSLSRFTGSMKIQYVILPKGKVQNGASKKVFVDPLEKRSLLSIQFPKIKAGENVATVVSLFSNDGSLAQRNYFVEQEWKHLRLPKAKIKYNIIDDESVVIKTNKPAFFVYLDSPGLTFNRNGFILLPEEEIKLKFIRASIKSKKVKSVHISCLNEHLS